MKRGPEDCSIDRIENHKGLQSYTHKGATEILDGQLHTCRNGISTGFPMRCRHGNSTVSTNRIDQVPHCEPRDNSSTCILVHLHHFEVLPEQLVDEVGVLQCT